MIFNYFQLIYPIKSLNWLEESLIILNPQVVQADKLKEWYSKRDPKSQYVGVSFDWMSGSMDSTNANERLIVEVSELLHNEFEKNSERGVYFTLNGYINNIKSDEKCMYNACPEESWGKKVFYQPDLQKYRCESWNQDFSNSKAKFMLMVRFSDFTDTLYWVFYKDTASMIMDRTADQLKDIKQCNRIMNIQRHFSDNNTKIIKF